MKYLIYSYILIFSFGCFPELKDLKQASNELSSDHILNIPDGFDFSTHRNVKIKVIDSENRARYDIFHYSNDLRSKGFETFQNEHGESITEEVFLNDILNNKVYSGVPNNGVLEITVNIPNYIESIYLRRKDGYQFTSKVIPIKDQLVEYTHNGSRKIKSAQRNMNTLKTDYLYGINGQGELFTIDPLDGSLTLISTMPMGSYNCALDQNNRVLYSIGRYSPFPLMKYSIDNDSWETVVGNLGQSGPRLAFNPNDGLLYFSTNDPKLYTVDPTNGDQLNSWDIVGLNKTNGGDLSFSSNGELHICTRSGLYKLELNGDGDYQGTRISTENFPQYPTSMTFDSNQEVWLAFNYDLITMDAITGGWQYKYGLNANNGTDFGRKITDLAILTVVDNDYVGTDTDGDTVSDNDDCAPNDPNIAFKSYTPSKYGTGTVAFEDLWPSTGDYDFNDVALNYQAILYTNSQNLAVKLEFICTAKSHRSGSINAIGFQFDNLASSKIQSVSNTQLFENYLTFNSNGTEANQEKAVVIITDNAHKMSDDLKIIVEFTEPINTNLLGTAPFNPFIIASQNREKEIHLPYKNSTNLGTYSSNSFIANTGYPWAISIVHDFKVPKEAVSITNGYNFFGTWATSGGSQKTGWYKDSIGNRNDEFLNDD